MNVLSFKNLSVKKLRPIRDKFILKIRCVAYRSVDKGDDHTFSSGDQLHVSIYNSVFK